MDYYIINAVLPTVPVTLSPFQMDNAVVISLSSFSVEMVRYTILQFVHCIEVNYCPGTINQRIFVTKSTICIPQNKRLICRL